MSLEHKYSVGPNILVKVSYYNVGAECEIEKYDGPEHERLIQSLKITSYYSTLKCFELPKSCNNCPVGYSEYHCGRNVPWIDGVDDVRRPVTCKLEKIDITRLLDFLNSCE